MLYFLVCFLTLILFLFCRLLFVIITTIRGCRKNVKRYTKDKVNTVIVVGSGGHTSEIMHLVQSLNPTRYSPRLYIMASSDKWSEQKILECEQKFKTEKHYRNDYSVFKIPRSRSVHQSYITSVFTTIYSTLASFPILLQFNPDVILCNGPMNAMVRLPAEAESYKVQTIAEGKRTQAVEAAKAEGEKIKLIGTAEAQAIECVGKADAERMRVKAQVYKQYGDAAIMSLVLDALPKIAAEVSAPLAKTEEIVLLGGSDHITGEVNRLVSQIPPSVHALTGVDLSKVLSKVPGAK